MIERWPRYFVTSIGFPALFSSSLALRLTNTTICTPEACLNGLSSQLSVGAVIENSDSRTILLPGTYNHFVDTSQAHTTTGFGVDKQPIGLVVYQDASLIAFSHALYRDESRIVGNSSIQTGLLGSFLLASGFHASLGMSGTPKVVVHDSCPDIGQWYGLKDLGLVSVESSTCTGGCGAGGRCTPQARCLCETGFTGSRCDLCTNGYFGPTCQPCPRCENGSGTFCDDGIIGTGSCLSLNSASQSSLVSASLRNCNCLNGVCTGATSCTCSAGWTTNANGTLCAQCMNGFFLDARGECVACAPGCQSCLSPSGTCQSCVDGFVVSATDSTTCTQSALNLIGAVNSPTSCKDGFYNAHNSTCAPCDSSCKACFGPSASACIQCSSTKALLTSIDVGTRNLTGACVDVDSTTGVCASPSSTGLFLLNQTKGVCEPAPRLCSAAVIPGFSLVHPGSTSAANAVCSACVQDAFLLNSGQPGAKCVGTCPVGTYDDRHGQCSLCPTGCSACVASIPTNDSRCLACTDSAMHLSSGECVRNCPAGTFAGLSPNDSPQALKGASVCLTCSASCGNCTSATTCQSCPKTRPAFDPVAQTCSAACPKGAFADTTSHGRCTPCDGTCITCQGPGPRNCLSCKVGATLRGGRCESSECAANITPVVPDWGVCLQELLTMGARGEAKGLPTWIIILIVLLSLLLIMLLLMIWRMKHRRRRQEKTKRFGNDLATADIKLHQLSGPATAEEHEQSRSAQTMSSFRSHDPEPEPPASPTKRSPSGFKVKHKSYLKDDRIESWKHDSVSVYSQSDYYYGRDGASSPVPELPTLPSQFNQDISKDKEEAVQWRTVQGSIWFENGLGKKPSEYFRQQS